MQESRQIIDMEEAAQSTRHPAQYPFAAEKELLQMMRLGLERELYV
ncbi:hypothetical protein [Paenibacillus radicis (ex Xue et al. 2023)]|uniref:Uncharacterized protein n=1 Tax=Paenibacillus radicis (ex Xue et al. 2023) TaxID=2972489 RepID=A0ABT1YCD2_9BACL|nr:hypothetical protein [Paenibacillus radicis (ex Xue et al. 2023)]MCR8630582.1 hypothetical protein [Paenibacillus radicis (ex Xue et al. 2023)]